MFFVYIFSLELMILHTNDHHGTLFNYWYEINEVAGLAERASIIKSIREGNENSLLLDAGDMNTGVYESNIFRAEPDIKSYNLIGYDAVTLGNHEFYGGLERVKQQIEWATFPFLSANVFMTDLETEDSINASLRESDSINASLQLGMPYVTFTMPNGLYVAVIGLTTTHKALHSDFFVKDGIEVATELVRMLRPKADIVIALTHLGIYDFGEEELYGSIRLAMNVPGIDLIIDGDSHTLLEEPAIVNGVPILQAGERGRHLGKAILNFDMETGEVSLTSWETIPLMRAYDDLPFEKDEEVFEVIEYFRLKAIEAGNEKLGYTTRPFRQMFINERIIALGRVVCEAMKEATIEYGTDVAFYNSGGIRADLLSGDIRISDVYNVLPFGNEIVVVEMPGTVLLDIMVTSFLDKVNTRGFLQYSNNVGVMQMPPDIVLPNLSGGDIEPDRIYKVATSSFLAGGGDGYTQFEYANRIIETGISDREALMEYIRTNDFFRENDDK